MVNLNHILLTASRGRPLLLGLLLALVLPLAAGSPTEATCSDFVPHGPFLTTINCPDDLDCDGVTDDVDLDDDNDGITDADEAESFNPVFFHGFEGGFLAGLQSDFNVTITGQDVALFEGGTGGQLGSPANNGGFIQDCGEGEDACEARIVDYPFTFGCSGGGAGGTVNEQITGNNGLFHNACVGTEPNLDSDDDDRVGELICFNNVPIDQTNNYEFVFDAKNIFNGPNYSVFVDIFDANGTFVDFDETQVSGVAGVALKGSIDISALPSGTYSFCIRLTLGSNGYDILFDNFSLGYYTAADTDGDGTADSREIDADDDGCPDADEAYGVSGTAASNGQFGATMPAVNANGLVTAAGINGTGDGYTTSPFSVGIENAFQEGVNLAFSASPTNQGALIGETATFTATPTLTPVASNQSVTSVNVSYKWQVSTDGGTSFSDIAGANGTVASGTEVDYTTPALAAGDNGNQYRVIVGAPANVCDKPEATASLAVSSGTAPDPVCPDNITVNNTPGTCEAIVDYDPAVDNTGIPAATITYSEESGTSFPVGTTTVTATATNIAGTEECSFMVTVVDNEAPQANCSPSGFVVDIDGPSVTFTAELLNDGSTDNCGTTNLSIEAGDQFVFTCADVGTSPTMTLIVDDGNGNSSSCDVTVNIEDGQAFCCAIDITSATPTTENCPGDSDGTITVTATGATTINYTLTLDGTAVATNQTGNFSGLASGEYTVSVADADNAACTETFATPVTVTVLDTDGDGVCDAQDLCPGTVAGLETNEDGCACAGDFFWSTPPVYTGNNYNQATGTINGVGYTFTSTNGVAPTANVYEHGVFPPEFGVPNQSTIRNDFVSSNTVTFASPVQDPVLVFASIGSLTPLNIPVTINFPQPVIVEWSDDQVTVNSPTSITGAEGNAIIRLVGTYTSFSFDYATAETYVNFVFGARVPTNAPEAIDSDGDGYSFCDGDCDDTNPDRNPGMPEICDGIDNDCDGLIDDEDPDFVAPLPVFTNCPATYTANLDTDGTVTVALGDLGVAATADCGFANLSLDAGSILTYNCDSPSENVGAITVNLNNGNGVEAEAPCVITVNVVDETVPTFACPSAEEVTLNVCGDITLTAADLGLSGTDNCGGAVSFAFAPASLSGTGTTPVSVTASDETGNTTTIACTIQVTTVENPDAFTVTADDEDLGTSCPGAPVTFTAATLLDGDVASNGATLEIQEVNSDQGTITDDGNGNYTFMPNAGVTGPVTLSYVVKAEGDDLFSVDNGHFYEFVVARDISWTDAKAAAEARTLNGQQGYLVTITSQAEQDFVETKLRGQGWMGASDAETPNLWKWVTGPEAGTAFYDQSTGMALPTGQGGNFYINWASGEPNNFTNDAQNGGGGDFLNGEAYGHFLDNGTWNDYPVSTANSISLVEIQGYMVEYGTADCVPDQTAVGSISLNIEDATPPQITCPDNVTEVATSPSGAVVTFADATATDNCTATVEQTGGPASGATFPREETTVEFTATDAGGNTATCTFTVTVSNAAPTLTCATPTVNADPNCMGAAAGAMFVETSDDPDGDELTISASPAGPYELGETEVEVTVSDGSLSSSCTTTITVVDATPPTITCPEPVSVNVDAGVCGAIVNYDIITADNCAGAGVSASGKNVLLLYGTAENNTPALVSAIEAAGHTVTLSAEFLYDGTNPAPDDFDVVVHLDGITWDTEMPESGQAALLAFVTDQNKTYVNTEFVGWQEYYYGWHTTLTEILPLEVVGTSFVDGPLDYVTVSGQEGHPVLNGLASTITLSEHRAYPTSLRGFAENPAVALMTSSQGPSVAVREFPDGGRAVGFQFAPNYNEGSYLMATVLTSPAAQQLIINAIEWQAGLNLTQNSGFASGELFPVGETTNDFTVTDPAGNSATCFFTVTVTDNEAPVASCADDFSIVLDVNGEAAITAADLDNPTTPSSDNCALTLSIDGGDQVFNCDDVDQTFTLTLIADDGNADSANDDCTVNVTVTDPNSVCYTCDLGFTSEDEENGIPPGIITGRVVCGDDGAIIVNAFCNGCDDGNGDLRYSINGVDFQAGNVFNGLAAGEYTVTVHDVDNPDCSATTTATIGECVGELPGNDTDDDCDTEVDEPSSIAWVLLDGSAENDACTSATDLCGQTFCYGLEYIPLVSGTLTSYTTGFLLDCVDGATPLLSNASCVMTDNSFDAAECANGIGAFFNASGNTGGDAMVELTKDEPIILHQICLTIPDATTLTLTEDAITDISMSITVAPVLSTDDPILVTDFPDYAEAGFSAAGNYPPVVTAVDIAACYDDVAAAEAAALAATTSSDDYTAEGDLLITVATVGDCAAVITVSVEDECGLVTEVMFGTRIDADAPVVEGALTELTEEGCSAADVSAPVTTVAALELMGVQISDNCSTDEELMVTSTETSEGTCPVVVTRVYTITDFCGKSVTATQTINVDDTMAPTFTGALTMTDVEGCDVSVLPAAATTVADLEALAGDLDVSDICTADEALVVTSVDEVDASACPIVVTRTYTVADGCGNPTEIVHTLRVIDTVDPELIAGTLADCYAVRSEALQAAIDATTATDNCGLDVTLSATSTGTCPATITVTGVDACGNDFSIDYEVIITDEAAPTEVGGPAETSAEIQTTLDVVEPTPPVFEDVCGNQLTGVGPEINDQYTEGECSGTIAYTWTYTDCAGTESTWTFTYVVDCKGLELRVFTEGNYVDGGTLSTSLNDNHLLPGQDKTLSPQVSVQVFADETPFGHPYQTAPWFYTANTGAGYGDITHSAATGGEVAYPEHVVDWVLVTVREDGIQPGNDVWTCTGWVHATGEVTFPDACPIDFVDGSTYHVIIEHRNHLPVMAQATLDAGATHITHDFTVADSYAPIFRFGQKQMTDGNWAMFTGNPDQTASRVGINSADRTAWRILQNLRGYYLGDFDQSLQVESNDETLWKNNQNKTSGIRFD